MAERAASADTRSWQVLREVWREGLSLMTAGERRRAALLVAATGTIGLVDTIALGTVMPFVALLVDPHAPSWARHLEALRLALGGPSISALTVIVGASCLMLVLASGIASVWLQRRLNAHGAACQGRLAGDLMARFVRAPYTWFLGVNATIVSHVFQRDVVLWARDFVLRMQHIFRDLALVLLPAALIILVTPLAGILALAAVGGILMLVASLMRPRIERLVREKQEADGRAFLLASQALVGAKDVKVSGRAGYFVAGFSEAYGRYAVLQARIADQHQLPISTIMTGGQVALFVVALVLWSLNHDASTLAAQLALLVLVTSRVVPAANRLASAVTSFFAVLPAITSLVRMREAVANPEAGDDRPRVKLHWRNLALEHVSFDYAGGAQPAIRDVSLQIERGRAYGIVGPSGAGKTTLVDVVLGLLAPSQGRLLVDGRPLAAGEVANWQAGIGYVAQAPFIADDTLAANVAFGVPAASLDQQRLERAIEMASLGSLLAQLSQGAATPLGDRGQRLSGGQRQRIAIARALYDESDLLILDEATSALDSLSERAVQEAIERLRGSVTTITIAHRLSTVRDCDRIFVMEDGRLVAQGSWSELLAGSPVFRAMVDAASGKEAA